jgi:ABC-type uncharacterized transport system permease subunit
VNDGAVIEFVMIAIAAGTPLVLAATGEILAERSGVMNLGLEGLLLVGAICAYWATAVTESLWLGVLAGALAGTGMAAIVGVCAISLRANQIFTGVAIAILGTGIASYLGEAGPRLSQRSSGGVFKPLLESGPADLPLIGPLLLGQNALTYLSWLCVLAASWYLFRTRTGLSLRAVGEDPATADASGLNVIKLRYLHVLVGGAAAGVAGASMTLALFGSWTNNLSNGTGWIAFAIVIFSAWRPWRALLAAYVFGGATSLGFNLQLLEVPIPLALLSALPYLLTLVALILVSARGTAWRFGAPAALGTPFWRESR